MTFSESVRQDRKDLGLSQRQLAQLCGIAQPRLSDIEHGLCPTQSQRQALEAVLGRQPDEPAYVNRGSNELDMPRG